MPTDWTIYFIYNLSYRAGRLVINSRVELLDEEDAQII